MRKYLSRYIGDKKFYALIVSVALPIILQNAITNFVSLMDNLMVGATGTESMSGVSIANQIMFVFYLSIFGAISGAGIFSAQFYGAKDHIGVRDCFRFKLIISVILTVLAIVIFWNWGDALIRLYLKGEDATLDPEQVLLYGRKYMRVMLLGMLPYSISQSYAGSLRETGDTKLPMLAGIAAVCVNVCFNYLLIFGNLGFPELGVEGAAIATVLSRFVELGIIVIYTHRTQTRHPFITGAYRSMRIPAALTKAICIKGLPLMVNEFFWSMGMATLAQQYSVRGLTVVAALNISNVVADLFNTVLIAIGNSAAILVGQSLGGSKMDEAKDRARKILVCSVLSCVVIGALMAWAAPLIPNMYNTEEDVRALATKFIRVCGCAMPIRAFANACYFILRSGGKTMITMLFDSVYSWVISVPLAHVLVQFTSLAILPLYAICSLSDICKCVLGAYMLKKGVWLHNIVENKKA